MRIFVRRFTFSLLAASIVLVASASAMANRARQCNVQLGTALAYGTHSVTERSGTVLVRWAAGGAWVDGSGNPVTMNCLADRAIINNAQHPGQTALVLSALAAGKAIDIYVDDAQMMSTSCFLEAVQFAYQSC